MARPMPPSALRRALLPALLLLPAALPLACVEQTGDSAGSAEVDVAAAKEHILTAAPAPRFARNATLAGPGGGKIVYLGSDVDAEVITAGKQLTLTHYFRVEQAVPEGWKMFVHLDAPGVLQNGRPVHLNADHVPVGGKYPVSAWKAGEIVRDVHKISVPPQWPADKVRFSLGFWKGGQRFAVQSGSQDGQNRALVADFAVQGASPQVPPAPKRLVVRKLKAGTVLGIDGKLDEPAWKDAVSTGPFVNTMDGSPAAQAASAKALWDDQALYVAFEFADNDVWGTLDKHDDKLWTQEAAEMFIDPDGDGRTYIELQVSPKNVTFDSWLQAYRQNDNAWDSGVQTGVQVSGTLNKRDDNDTGWTVEMRIPMAAVKGRLEQVRGVPPQPGTEWRANFFRMDLPAGKPQSGTGWSPPLIGDFHALHRFGTLVFADDAGTVPGTPATLGASPAGAPGAGPATASAGGPHALSPMLQRAMQADPNAPAPPEPLDRPATGPGKPTTIPSDKPAEKPEGKPEGKPADKPEAKPGPGKPTVPSDKQPTPPPARPLPGPDRPMPGPDNPSPSPDKPPAGPDRPQPQPPDMSPGKPLKAKGR